MTRRFSRLQPTVAVVNNVEADHLECYGSVDALEARVRGIRRPRVAGADRHRGRRLRSRRRRAGDARLALRHGARRSPLSRRANSGPDGSTADVALPDGRIVRLTLQVPGVHNLRNATAALGVVVALDADIERALEALAAFSGVGRRFERLGDVAGITIVDDYAHHPTELAATLAAARQAFPDRRLVAVFQPHLYSRTREHGVAMGRALAAADLVVVAESTARASSPSPASPASWLPTRLSAAGAVVHIRSGSRRARRDGRSLLRDGDVLLTLGAGDVTRVGPAVRALLAAR